MTAEAPRGCRCHASPRERPWPQPTRIRGMSTKSSQEETMQQRAWDRRDVLWGLSVMAGAGVLGAGASPAAAQQVKYSSGTEPAKLKAPADACDCHHHIYRSQYKVDPRSTLRPGDATVDDYRALQKRIGTSRNVIVQPSTYGTENAPTLDALQRAGAARFDRGCRCHRASRRLQ